ncbi:helix-turn-helix DNA binding domain protein [Synechococcus phage Ssp-JY40]
MSATARVPNLLTEPEAAARLHTCTKTLRRARQEGRLHFVKIGKTICYTEQDLADFIDRQRQCAAPQSPRRSPAPKPKRPGVVVPFSQMAGR